MIEDKLETLKKLEQTDLNIAHHFSDGLYAKEMHLPASHCAISHKHNYGHLAILGKGIAKVKTDETQNIYEAPACIDISAGVNHEITAIEDVIWFCIHKTDEKDIKRIDEVLIKRGE